MGRTQAFTGPFKPYEGKEFDEEGEDGFFLVRVSEAHEGW